MSEALIIMSFIVLQNSWLWEFKKHPNNPVVPHGEDGEWDDTYAIDGHLLKAGDTLKIYYVGYNGDYDTSFPSKGIGYSYSVDFGNTWNKYSGNPVFVSDSSGWERTDSITGGLDGMWEAAIRKGNLYQMWYQAKDSTNHQNTLYATSEDGIHWVRRNSGIPVLRADPFYWRWDSWWAGARSVIQAEDSFYLFYEGVQLGGGPTSLGLAVGPNETTFTKVDTLPVFSPINTDDTLWSGESMIPTVIYMNSTFVLFYSSDYEGDRLKARIGIAFSKDGRIWRRYKRNPVYDGETGEPGAWDSLNFTLIDVENIGSEKEPLLWGTYRSRVNTGWLFSLGLVTIDAKDLVPPSAPTLIMPHNGAIISNSKPEFCYNKAEDNFSGVEYYILEYQQASSEPLSVETEDTVYIPSTELEDGAYIWRVQAIDSAGWESDWSTGTFIIEGGNWKSFFVTLFPNPVVRYTTIRYYVPVESKILLKIYDITGSIVKTLIDRDVNSGYHNINWDTGDLSNGIYFVKFYVVPKREVGKEYKGVRKLILAR